MWWGKKRPSTNFIDTLENTKLVSNFIFFHFGYMFCHLPRLAKFLSIMPHIKETSKGEHINERLRVYNGTINRTSGGLTKGDLKKNKQGLLVSRRASAAAKKRWNKMPQSKMRLFEKNQQTLIDGHVLRKKSKSKKRSKSRR